MLARWSGVGRPMWATSAKTTTRCWRYQTRRCLAGCGVAVRWRTPGTSTVVWRRICSPAMTPTTGNRNLLQQFDLASRDLGLGELSALDPLSRGASDISFVASFTDALSGLGPFGEGSHSMEERLELDSLLGATQRAALIMYRLTR